MLEVLITDIEDMIEFFGLFSKFFAKKRPPLTNKQEKGLLMVLKTRAFGDEYFINIADSVSSEHRGLLPESVFVKNEQLSCKCKDGKLCGVWPNNGRRTNCKKQKVFLSTLSAIIANTLLAKRIVAIVNGSVVSNHNDACSMQKELCQVSQHATQD